MTTPQLPERPNLEQLKRQAKDLLRAAKRRDATALARFRTLPAFAGQRNDETLIASIALHDAQSVIARELGLPSWSTLVERVEELTLEFGAAVTEFVEAATEVRPERAERLLQLHPRIATASFHTALLLGDLDRVERQLANRPALALDRGGPRDWEPLLYVCHTAPTLGAPARGEGLVAIARRLLELGADPNTRFPWLHHGVRRGALWGAVCVTRSLPLAEVLLDGGADPNDGVTLPLAAGGGDIPSLELLYAHGADVNQRWASDDSPALYSILNWADTTTGACWLLDHGADPDAVFAPNGETALHVTARRLDADLAARLVHRGADMNRRRGDGRTPYAVAELSGNETVATWLADNGADTTLSDVDRFVGACSRSDGATAAAMLRAQPALRDQIAAEHYSGFYRVAERGDAKALDTMLACGFDPNRGDEEIGKTALHAASMEGRSDAVRALLAHGASVSVRDREFHGQPLVWAADGFRNHGNNGRDYSGVARLLLEAGSPVDWEEGEEPSQAITEIIEGWRRSVRRTE